MTSRVKDYTDTFVLVDKTIFDALQSIDNTALQIALVVDEDGKLVGTVTDGDIRRAILAGTSLENPITEVMNKNPTTVTPTTDLKEILDVMTEKKIYQVPMVDENGHVTGLERMRDLLKRKADVKVSPSHEGSMEDVWTVLMLGGEGKRLQPLTQDMPKPMVSIGGRPLLETILQSFVEQNFKRFFFSVNYKADMIRDYFGDGSGFGAEISYLLEGDQMGTAGSLSLLPERPQGPLVVMNGDLLTNVNFDNLVDFHRQNKAMATMCVREYNHEVPYGIVQNNGAKLDSIIEKPSQSYFVNAGIYVLDPAAIDLIPKDTFFDMPQLFDKIRETGGESTVFPIHEYWLDIGRFEDLERARAEYDKVFNC